MKNQQNNIAVLITCFNRKEKTIRCLTSLYEIIKNIDIYLTDDLSVDGTSETISTRFPYVNIIRGNGELYWSRGMNLSWNHASKKDYNFYLWLNDDVILYDNSIIELFECSSMSRDLAIISGCIESHDKSRVLYGGSHNNSQLITPNGKLQNITFMNGNVVLIPKFVFSKLGFLDSHFHHDLGDVDYGLRANKKNIKVVTTRTYIGSCDDNELCRVRYQNQNIFIRFKKLYSPLGSNPFINFYFRRVHFGLINACTYFMYLHFINVIPNKLIKLIFKSKYLN